MEDTTKTGETQTLDTTTVGQVDVNIDELVKTQGTRETRYGPELLIALVGVRVFGVQGSVTLLRHALTSELIARKASGVGVFQ